MTINEWRDVIYANAVDKGWWSDERPLDEDLCLIISELFEALVEYQSGNPFFYMECNAGIECCTYVDHEGPICPDRSLDDIDPGKPCKHRTGKPEGVAVEMADALMRILSYAGHKGIDMDRVRSGIAEVYPKEPLTSVMMSVTYCLSSYWMVEDISGDAELNLCKAAAYIIKWFEQQNLDVWKIVAIKHEYNKTRPFRHGRERA